MSEEQQAKKKGLPGWAKIVAGLAIIAALVVVSRFLPLVDWFMAATSWVQDQGAVGIVVFILLYAGATLIGGATPLTLAAGVIWGLWGVLIVSPASVIGASIAFLLGRGALRNSVRERVSKNKRFAAIEKAVGDEGFKIVGLLRLSPVFPFTALNYGLGLTSVKFRDYVLASFLGMLPGTLMYVYFGVLAGNLTAVFQGPPTTDVTYEVTAEQTYEGTAHFPKDIKVGQKVAFSAEPANDAITYTWDFGENDATATGASVKYKYETEGNHNASLMVAAGSESASVSAPVLIKPPPTFFEANGKLILLIVGLLATVVVTTFVTRIARKALSSELETGESGPDAAAPDPAAVQT